MIKKGTIVLGSLLWLIGGVACGPLHQTVRPNGNNYENVKKLAIVIPAEGEFTVFYQRAKATATPAVIFGLVGAAVGSAYNKSQDEALAKSIGNHLDGFSCREVFRESLIKSLIESERFSEIQVFAKEPESSEISKYDAVLTFRIPNFGIRIVERGQKDLMAGFVEVEAQMVQVPVLNVIWDERETILGPNNRALNSYQNDEELVRKDLYEATVDAGQRMANILIYEVREGK